MKYNPKVGKKMVRLTVDVTLKEMDDLEDLLFCWNLCKEHNEMPSLTTEDYFRFMQTCKKCKTINKKIRDNSARLWTKLAVAQEKAEKPKRKQKLPSTLTQLRRSLKALKEGRIIRVR